MTTTTNGHTQTFSEHQARQGWGGGGHLYKHCTGTLPAMVTISCPTCTPASFILSKEVSHSSYFHIFHTFCTLFSDLKEGGGQQSMIVGMRRGANCVKPVSNVSMGEGESKICTALRSRARASRIKKRDRDRGRCRR